MPIPNNYQRLMPYLLLSHAADFFDWMQSVFNATEQMRQIDADGTIRHCELVVAGHTIMYSGANEDWSVQTGGFFLYLDDADAAFAKALISGATEVMPMTQQDYGRSGGVKDPFGNTWWITQIP